MRRWLIVWEFGDFPITVAESLEREANQEMEEILLALAAAGVPKNWVDYEPVRARPDRFSHRGYLSYRG